MMDDDERYAAVRALHERARHLRGSFLNSVAVIEHKLALLFTDYFCRDDDEKRRLFFERVMKPMSLDRKKKLLVDIVKADYPRYWDEHQEILKNIDKLREFRNALAHSILDVSDEALERPLKEGVGFVQWQKGEPVTEEAFQEYEVMANMVSGALNDIKLMLPYKQLPHE